MKILKEGLTWVDTSLFLNDVFTIMVVYPSGTGSTEKEGKSTYMESFPYFPFKSGLVLSPSFFSCQYYNLLHIVIIKPHSDLTHLLVAIF